MIAKLFAFFASESRITFDSHYARIVDQQTQDYLGSWRPLSMRVTKGPKYPTDAEILEDRERRLAEMHTREKVKNLLHQASPGRESCESCLAMYRRQNAEREERAARMGKQPLPFRKRA